MYKSLDTALRAVFQKEFFYNEKTAAGSDNPESLNTEPCKWQK